MDYVYFSMQDLNGENLCKEVEKNDVQGDDAHKHSSDPVIDALADSQMVKVHMVTNFLYVYQLHIE